MWTWTSFRQSSTGYFVTIEGIPTLTLECRWQDSKDVQTRKEVAEFSGPRRPLHPAFFAFRYFASFRSRAFAHKQTLLSCDCSSVMQSFESHSDRRQGSKMIE
jgi:hypothetical protein